MRYQETHRWITFQWRAEYIDQPMWLKLGECQAKCNHIGQTALDPEVSNELHKIYLAKGVHATTAIEGNTLNEDDVVKHIEGKLKLPPSQEYQAKEIDNIINACNAIGKRISSGESIEITPSLVKQFNNDVLNGLPLNDEVIPGVIRKHSVGVANYRGAPAEDCGYLLERLCSWINGPDFRAPDEGEKNLIVYAFIRAILFHVYLAWIHPFADGNGRTARILEFLILLETGVTQPACHLLSNHYNQTRMEYYRQLAISSKTGGDLKEFIKYALQGFADGLDGQMEYIRKFQLDCQWMKLIYDSFDGIKAGPHIKARARKLIREISKRNEGVKFSEIRGMSPEISEQYANKSPRTIRRDIRQLMDMKLLRIGDDGGFKATKDRLLSMRPFRVKG